MKEPAAQSESEGVQATVVAGTPSSLPPVASPSVLDQLQFDRALELVARHAVNPMAAARVRARRPLADVGLLEESLAAVEELRRVLARDDPFRPEPVPDLSGVIERLGVEGSVLEGVELAGLLLGLSAMRLLAREIERLAGEAPRLAAMAAELPPRSLDRALERAVDSDGRLKDEASPELKRARARTRETRNRLVGLLESVMQKVEPGLRPGEQSVTVRNGRYVIPLRRGVRSRLRGIVHGESASGTTLFVEPEEAVELGNELAQCEAEEARAEARVLRELSELARQHRAAIAAGFEMCIQVDELYARARYAASADAALPKLIPAPGKLIIRNGRHPLLLAEKDGVVPFDLKLGGVPGENVVSPGAVTGLVISGPNTGGKTVLIKAVGLISALAQSGIIPPVGEGTVLPVFRRIFTDIGDHQSITASLSTFSAHVAALKEIVEQADAASLVLIDEIGTGTDPREGAALAGAVLELLARKGVMVIATTHLTQLKELAARTPGLENASLSFDAATLTPTYRLVQGIPGRSYGLAIARRLGLEPWVLGRAEELVPEEQRRLESLLEELERREADLNAKQRELEFLRKDLAAERERLEALRAELERAEEELDRRARELERSGREQARRFLLEARRRVEEALALARAQVTEATAREARRLVEEGVKREAEELKRLEEAARRKGWTLRVGGEPGGAKQATVPQARPAARVRKPATESPEPQSLTEVDLRGLSVEEAAAALVSAVDSAVVNDAPFLRIIHGKGTGALRAKVKEVLEKDRRVASFRLGLAQEGGSGVTIAEFNP
ncbi:MAG: endonuclease MutS2 [Gemmatimonadales bacterium]|nr:MAG: endonuclease MutS2 [Gemmatimonadales bacterium]